MCFFIKRGICFEEATEKGENQPFSMARLSRNG
jgi:hypothetical protein